MILVVEDRRFAEALCKNARDFRDKVSLFPGEGERDAEAFVGAHTRSQVSVRPPRRTLGPDEVPQSVCGFPRLWPALLAGMRSPGRSFPVIEADRLGESHIGIKHGRLMTPFLASAKAATW